ncbi:MAG: hypothetical protein IJN03_03225 [Bacilli bacterium]|nr:hypothetical protein [Bacilli bacterium]
MAIFCSDECEKLGVICSFCRYFVAENDRFLDDEGMCSLHNLKVDSMDGCGEFICFKVED